MAAVTTLSAGAAVLPSSLVAYQQIGTFVVVVMVTSWIYSTLFLPSMLRICGPQHGFSQLRCCPAWSCLYCCCLARPTSPTHHFDKTVYSYGLSESTMSTSVDHTMQQQQHGGGGELHELEPLNLANNRIKTDVRSNRPRSGSLAAVDAPRPSNDLNVQSSNAKPNSTSRNRKVSLPSTALLASSTDEPEVVCIETQNSDMWAAWEMLSTLSRTTLFFLSRLISPSLCDLLKSPCFDIINIKLSK